MSLDTRITSAVEDLERQTTVDVAAGLERLRRAHRRRATTRGVTLVAVAALLVAGVVWRLGGPTRPPDPAPAPEQLHVSNGALVSIEHPGMRVVAAGKEVAHLPAYVRSNAHLAWSADGTELVYDTTTGTLVALDVATGDVRTLTTCATPCLAGASPDTSQIALASEGELRISTPDGESVITLPGLSPGVPVWSPDATRIAFSAPTGLYVVGADGSGLHRLLASPDPRVEVIAPSWSPDGESLAYLAGTPVPGNPGGTADVLLTAFSVVAVDAASGSALQLAEAGECFCLGLPPGAVSWSPDGTTVGFTVTRVIGLKGIFTVPALGGKAERLNREQVGGALAWQPIAD